MWGDSFMLQSDAPALRKLLEFMPWVVLAFNPDRARHQNHSPTWSRYQASNDEPGAA